MISPLRGPLLNQAVQERLKDYITNNHLQPGDPLPAEAQLAADLGVSRGSVREAIKSLESLGIVEVRHGSGIYVRRFNFDSIFNLLSYGVIFEPSRINEILQIRKWLEEAAIADVCEKITADRIAEIEDLLARWEVKARRNESVDDEDRAFHRMLYQAIENESLVSLIDIFWVVYHRVGINKRTRDDVPINTLQDHRDILAAIAARDSALARRLITNHFTRLEQRIASLGGELTLSPGASGSEA
jgi:DNA-binding FadR family transcriptional regulator